MKKIIASPLAPKAVGPYSQAVETDGALYVSGQLPIDGATGKMAEGIEAQTKQSLANVCAILEAAGLTVDNVVKTTVFLSDMANFGPMNEVYASVFTAPYPARSAVAVRELPKGVLVEIEVIAAR